MWMLKWNADFTDLTQMATDVRKGTQIHAD